MGILLQLSTVPSYSEVLKYGIEPPMIVYEAPVMFLDRFGKAHQPVSTSHHPVDYVQVILIRYPLGVQASVAQVQANTGLPLIRPTRTTDFSARHPKRPSKQASG
jgi:hypothetical protein